MLPSVVSRSCAALYLDGLDAVARAVLDATSVLHRGTFSLLGAVLPGQRPQNAFAPLDALPFVELSSEAPVGARHRARDRGALLRATDPVTNRGYRAAAWRQIRVCCGGSCWASIADMIALVDEPLVREAFMPTRSSTTRSRPHSRTTATRSWRSWRATNGPSSIASAPGGKRSTTRSGWLAARVARSSRSRSCAASRVPRRLMERDPFCVPGERTAHPSRPAERTVLSQLRPRVEHRRRSVALLCGTPARYRAGVTRGGSDPAAISSRAREEPARAARRDRLRPAGRSRRLPTSRSVTSSRVGGRLALKARGPRPRRRARGPGRGRPRASPRRRRIALSKLECRVLAYLLAREGQPVPRETLLRDVWGTNGRAGRTSSTWPFRLRRKLVRTRARSRPFAASATGCGRSALPDRDRRAEQQAGASARAAAPPRTRTQPVDTARPKLHRQVGAVQRDAVAAPATRAARWSWVGRDRQHAAAVDAVEAQAGEPVGDPEAAGGSGGGGRAHGDVGGEQQPGGCGAVRASAPRRRS